MNPQKEPQYPADFTTSVEMLQQPISTSISGSHSSKSAVAALVLGILSIVLACIPILPTICGTLGILFVIKARKQEQRLQNGLVIAGLILSICGLLLSLLCLIYWIWYICFFLQMVEPQRETPPPMPKYHGNPAKFHWTIPWL